MNHKIVHIGGLTIGAFLGVWASPYFLELIEQGQNIELISLPIKLLLVLLAVGFGLLVFALMDMINRRKP